MRKLVLVAGILLLSAAPALAQETAPAVSTEISASVPQAPSSTTQAARGQTLVASNGARIGRVIRIVEDGSPAVIFEGRVITVPLATLTLVDGRLVSTLSRAEIASLP